MTEQKLTWWQRLRIWAVSRLQVAELLRRFVRYVLGEWRR